MFVDSITSFLPRSGDFKITTELDVESLKQLMLTIINLLVLIIVMKAQLQAAPRFQSWDVEATLNEVEGCYICTLNCVWMLGLWTDSPLVCFLIIAQMVVADRLFKQEKDGL